LVRRTGRDRVGLQRVLDLLAPRAGRRRIRCAVVHRLVDAVAADVRAGVDLAVGGVQQVEGRAGDHAAAVRLLLRRVRQEPRSQKDGVGSADAQHLTDRRSGPRLADRFLHRRRRRFEVAVRHRVAGAGDRVAMLRRAQRRIEAGVGRERPVQPDRRRVGEVAQHRRLIVAVPRGPSPMMRCVRQQSDGWSVSQMPGTLTSEIFGDPSMKKSKLPTGWPSRSVRSFGNRFSGMKPHSSMPVRASIASRMPRLVPAHTIVRRFLLATAKPGYASSGGGSRDGGFITAGVESMTAPIDWLRTWLMIAAVSVRLVNPISGINVAALATVNAIMLPL